MIYLIDFPGYGTGNIFETEIYNKVMSICNAFIFVVRNSVIKENDTKKILDSMFNQVKQQKKNLANKFIKSCLFIFNNDNKQPTTDKDIEIAKNDITDIIKGVDKEDLNMVFFNAKFYCNYCSNFNYFFNIENLLRMQYDNFVVYKNNIFTYPELFTSKKYNTFGEYIYKELMDRIKNEEIGSGKIKSTQKVKKDVHEKIAEIIQKYNFMNPEDYSKYGKLIDKVICYGQDNINTLKTLNQSNIGEFKKDFISQINCINNEMQEDIKEKIQDVISMLDLFFSEKEKRDSKEKENFIKSVSNISEKMYLLIESSDKEIQLIIEEIKMKITNAIKTKEENINKLLDSKNYKDIIKEINNEISNNLEKLNKWIEDYLEKYNSESEKFFNGEQELLKYIKGQNILKLKKNFKIYFSKKVGSGRKNIAKEIYDEIINSTESLGNIFMEKGFINWIKSLFSDYHYLSNIMNIVINTYLNRVNKILFLLAKSFKDYIKEEICSLSIQVLILEMKFNDEQLEIWKNLLSFYKKKKAELIKINN